MKDLIFPPALCEAINMHFITPMRTGMNASPGLLLHGPAGTGKSSIAKAVAGETSSGLIVVGPGDARSQWSGKADKFIQAVFEKAASFDGPCVVFFDELDDLLTDDQSRGGEGNSTTQFKISCDPEQLKKQRVVVIGATNHLDRVARAVRDRLVREVLVERPPPATIAELMMRRLLALQYPFDIDDTTLLDYALRIDGASMRKLNEVIESAGRRAAFHKRNISMGDIESEAAILVGDFFAA